MSFRVPQGISLPSRPPPCPRACGDPSPPLEPNVIPSPSRNLVAITAPLRVLAHAGTHPLLFNQMSFRVPQGISLPSRFLTSSPRRGGSRTARPRPRPTRHSCTPLRCSRVEPAPVKTGAGTHPPSPPTPPPTIPHPNVIPSAAKRSRGISLPSRPPLRVLAHAGTHPLLLNQMSFRVPRGISSPSRPPLRVLAHAGTHPPPLQPNVIPSPSRESRCLRASSPPLPVGAVREPPVPAHALPVIPAPPLRCSRVEPAPVKTGAGTHPPSPPTPPPTIPHPNVIPSAAKRSRGISLPSRPPSPSPRACGDPSPPLEPHIIPSPSRNLAAITAPLSVSSSHAGTHPPHHSPPKHHSERSEAEPRNLAAITAPSPCPRACGDPSPPLEPHVIPSPSRNLVAITAPSVSSHMRRPIPPS